MIDLQYSGEENLEMMNKAVNYNRRLLTMLSDLIVSKNWSVADFGAGNGYFAKMLKNMHYENIVCIEPMENMQRYLNGFTVLPTLDEVDDCSLNFIYSLNVLEHIEDDIYALKLIYNKLKDGGLVFIYVPAFQCLFSNMDKKVGHYRRYAQGELKKKIKQVGLTVEDCRYADFLGFFASLFFKLLPKQSGALSVRSIKFYDKFIFPISVVLDKLTKGKLLGKNLYLIARKK